MRLSKQQQRRFRSDASAMLGLGIVSLLVLFAVIAPWVVSDPNASDFVAVRQVNGAPPGSGWQHLLGTDKLFRDTLARLAFGARVSLTIALSSVVLAVGVGAGIGLVAGFLANTRFKLIDSALMRIVDIALAFPYLLLITAIGVAVERTDAVTVVLILGLTSWTGIARITRAKTLQIMSRDYITAARALGAGGLHIIRRHLVPGVWPTLLIIGTHAVAHMILAEAVLGYLTVGIEPPRATWGRMLQEAETYIGVAPLMVAAPGGLILLAALGFTRLGDGLREAIDPKASASIVRRRGRGRLLVDLALLTIVATAVMFSGGERLAGPRPAEAAGSPSPRRGGVLRLASMTPVPRLDPATAYDDGSRAINDLLFARLVTHDGAGRLVPELAQSFAVKDGKRFVFVLSSGLRLHDGASLTAKDFKRSLERTLHPKSSSPGAHLYRAIQGYAAFRKAPAGGLSGVTVIDERTLVIELDQPDVSFLSLLALDFAAPVCSRCGPYADRNVPVDPCGAGPFKVKALALGARLLVERFEHYHVAGKPYLDGVEWLQGVPARTQRYRFERGELDIVTELTGIDSFRFADDDRWSDQRHWVAKPITSFIFLNTRVAPFDNVHLRRAVAFAVDPRVLSKVRADIGPADRVLPPAVPGPERNGPMRRHDVQAALREMSLAGYAFDPQTGRGGYPDVIEYLTIPNTFEQAAAEVFQQQLAKVGLRLRLKLVSFAAWSTLISSPRRTQMGWRGWGADYADPSSMFAPILTTAAITPQNSQNVSFYSNPELDALIDKTAVTIERDERMDLFRQAEEIVRDDAPLVPVYVIRSMHLVQPVVRGYVPHKVAPLRVRDVWLDRGSP